MSYDTRICSCALEHKATLICWKSSKPPPQGDIFQVSMMMEQRPAAVVFAAVADKPAGIGQALVVAVHCEIKSPGLVNEIGKNPFRGDQRMHKGTCSINELLQRRREK